MFEKFLLVMDRKSEEDVVAEDSEEHVSVDEGRDVTEHWANRNAGVRRDQRSKQFDRRLAGSGDLQGLTLSDVGW